MKFTDIVWKKCHETIPIGIELPLVRSLSDAWNRFENYSSVHDRITAEKKKSRLDTFFKQLHDRSLKAYRIYRVKRRDKSSLYSGQRVCFWWLNLLMS